MRSERAELCSRLRCRTLVGQRCKGQTAPPPIQLRKADDEAAINFMGGAEGSLCRAGPRPAAPSEGPLLARVIAMRDWVETDEATASRGAYVTLTCRKGSGRRCNRRGRRRIRMIKPAGRDMPSWNLLRAALLNASSIPYVEREMSRRELAR